MIDQSFNINENCTGCYACYSVCPQSCISMLANEEGFISPSVNSIKCVRCGKCMSVCPILNPDEREFEPSAIACQNRINSSRIKSSSGGVFVALSERIIELEGVVYGAAFNSNCEVEHKSVDSHENIHILQGSKYVQSKIGDSFIHAKEQLSSGKQVLFSGTPCQIAGLMKYLGKKYERLLTIDIVCHGVPSPAVFKKYIEARERLARSRVTEISFRDKKMGWKNFSMRICFENKRVYCRSKDQDPYLKSFLQNGTLRRSCYACRFKGEKRHSDITLADFWGVQNLMPDIDDDKGTSLVLLHSPTGKQMFESIAGDIFSNPADVSEALKYNSAALNSVKRSPFRDQFIKEVTNDNFIKLAHKYFSESPNIRIRRRLLMVIKKLRLEKLVRKIRKK